MLVWLMYTQLFTKAKRNKHDNLWTDRQLTHHVS